MSNRVRMGFAALVSLCANALIIDGTNIGRSKRIPRQGDTVVWQVPILNEGEEPFKGVVTVVMRASPRGERLGPPVVRTEEIELAPGAARDFAFEWLAEPNGYHGIVFELPGADASVSVTVAVVTRDVYFVWFGAPQDFGWCNVPTTVKPESREWWLRRGAIPAAWKGGVCYKEWPVEKFVESWGETDWIAIDEVGGPGPVTDTFIEAWRRLRQSKPTQWTAVWFMGAHRYWSEVRDLIDLFVPEIYLNYRGNHLGQFDAYFRTGREAGVMDQVIPGLGINERKTKDKERVINSPTKADVLRQVRYVKRTAPELPGIGFFTSYSAAWGVAEYADALCETYFVSPVLTILRPDEPLRVSERADAGRRVVTASVRNVGNMDARQATVEWRWGWAERGEHLRTENVRLWPVGEERTFSLEAECDPGWVPVEFRIVPAEGYTVLDGRAGTHVVRLPPDFADTQVVLPHQTSGASHPLPVFAQVDHDAPSSFLELARDLSVPSRGVCAILPARPGMEERTAVFVPGAEGPTARLFVLSQRRPVQTPAMPLSREGDLLTISNDFYRCELDLVTDQLVTLAPAGGMANLFRKPWALNATGHEGFGRARVTELPGCLVVTIPFSSEHASGESQYLFLTNSPAIRVARSWVPKGEVTLKGAGERCGLFQRGGTFVLQPGVGGAVRRGRLQDSSAYRDLLFGYLGEAPRPENADRAGWIDFSYGAEGADGGLGVAIEYRWQDSDTKSYDVTRLYDASDWLEVLFLWGKEKLLDRPQKACVYLVPHRGMDFTDPSVASPAQALWERLHRRQLAWVTGPR